MSDNPAGRILAALDDPAGWLITQAGMDLLREVAAREHDYEAFVRGYGKRDPEPLSFVQGSTAVLDVRGAMTRRASMFSNISGLSSTDALSDEFARLEASDEVERIVIRMDTPGGQVSGLSEFAERIYAATTPTVAYASDMAASAGYWLASQADEVIVSPTAIVGSIGVRGRAPELPDSSEMVSRHAPAKLGDRAASQAALDRLEQEFHAAIARGRGVDAEHVAEHFGRGGIFVGSDAVNAGLADRVSTFDYVLADAGQPPSRRVRGIQANNEDSQMAGNNDGGTATAENETALANAKQAGYDEGVKAADKKAAEAVTAERERVSAILEAGEGKAAAQVRTLIDEGVSAESATKILAATPDELTAGVSALSSVMDGSNARVASDNGDQSDEDREYQDAEAGWDKAFNRGAA